MKPKGLARHLIGTSALAATIAVSFTASSAFAAAEIWDAGAGTTNWSDAANWTNDSLPSAGTATINTDTGIFPIITSVNGVTPGFTDIILGAGAANAGRIDHISGSVSTGINNWVYVQNGSSANSVYNLADTTVTGQSNLTTFGQGSGSLTVGDTSVTSGRLLLGNGGTGTGTFNMNTTGTLTTKDTTIGMLIGTNGGDGIFNLDSGTVNTGIVWLGDNSTASTGTLNIAGGAFNSSNLLVGRNGGTGIINMSGGTLTNTATFRLTAQGNAASRGILNISGGTITSNNMWLGDAGGTTAIGVVNQTGGSITLLQAAGIDNLRVGSTNNGIGVYNISGGSVTSNRIAIGASLASTVGVMNVSGTATVTANERIEVVAGTSNTLGLLNVTGGSVTSASDVRFFTNTGAATQQAVMNIGGGIGNATVTTGNSATQGVNMAQTGNVAGMLGVVNLLSNGTLVTGRVLSTQANPTTHFNFNGGTLKVTTTNAGTIFNDAGPDAINVYSGGGTIDNSGTAITIDKVLAAPTGNGANSNPIVTTGGTGYVGAPIVTVSGTGGSGATAYATVSGGVVTGIVVTSAGTGYTGDLSFTLTGGGGTGATIGNVTSTANVGGGMTFTGTGLTTLSAANTYTGPTTVLNGTLITGATGTFGLGNVTVADVSGAGLTLGNGNSIADTATLFFGDAALITLNNATSDTVFGITQTDDSQSIGAGTYTAGDLNTFFGVSSFAGTGSLTVVPEPAVTLLGGLGLLGILRRRRVA